MCGEEKCVAISGGETLSKSWKHHRNSKDLGRFNLYQVDIVCPKKANIEPLLWLGRCLEGNPNSWKSQHDHWRDKKLPTDLDGMSMLKKIRDVEGSGKPSITRLELSRLPHQGVFQGIRKLVCCNEIHLIHGAVLSKLGTMETNR